MICNCRQPQSCRLTHPISRSNRRLRPRQARAPHHLAGDEDHAVGLDGLGVGAHRAGRLVRVHHLAGWELAVGMAATSASAACTLKAPTGRQRQRRRRRRRCKSPQTCGLHAHGAAVLHQTQRLACGQRGALPDAGGSGGEAGGGGGGSHVRNWQDLTADGPIRALLGHYKLHCLLSCCGADNAEQGEGRRAAAAAPNAVDQCALIAGGQQAPSRPPSAPSFC